MPTPSHLVQNYRRAAIRFVRGQGSRLYDADGKGYLDAFAGVAVSSLGYGHPKLVEAIARQAAAVTHVSNYYTIDQQEELATALVAASFPGRVLFCNSGTEANECAFKVARLWANQVHGGTKPRMLSFHGGFHGRTMGSLAVTSNAAYRTPFAPLAECDFIPFNDVAALEAAITDQIAAVWVEPVQGEGGVIPAAPGFLARLRELCDRHHVLVVADEVQTGLTRCGSYFAHQQDGITPDLMPLAKGLGGGVPIGACVMSERCADLLKPGLHGTTFGGNPLACAAGLVVAEETLTPVMAAQVIARGEQLRADLATVFPDALAIRGRGLLVGVQLPTDPAPLITKARDLGLIVGPAANNTVRLAPPLIITAPEIDEICGILAQARA